MPTMNVVNHMESAHEETLEAVASRAARGDVRAVGALFERFYDGVYRYALFRIGNEADAEEAAGEVFVQLVRSVRRYRSRGVGFPAWLFSIARNVVADHHRRKARRPEDATDELPELPTDNLETIVEGREQVRSLRSALATLPDEQAHVLMLRFSGGLTAEEVGAVLGKSAGAVRIQQMRALSALRQRLESTHEH